MQLRGHANGVAIALAGLAVVVAGTGTTYAVAASTVNIADPVNPSRIANVTSGGRLATAGVLSNLDLASNYGFDGTTVLTGSTTASLAISSISFANPLLNSQFGGTTYNVSIVKIHAGTTGECFVGTNGAYVERYLGPKVIDPGDNVEQTFPAPLVVKPTGSDKYCLGLSVNHFGGTQNSLYLSTFQLTGFVASGSYTGPGQDAAMGEEQATAPTLVTR